MLYNAAAIKEQVIWPSDSIYCQLYIHAGLAHTRTPSILACAAPPHSGMCCDASIINSRAEPRKRATYGYKEARYLVTSRVVHPPAVPLQLAAFESGLLRKSIQHADERRKAIGTPTPVQR